MGPARWTRFVTPHNRVAKRMSVTRIVTVGTLIGGLSSHTLDALNDARELDAEGDPDAEGRRMSR